MGAGEVAGQPECSLLLHRLPWLRFLAPTSGDFEHLNSRGSNTLLRPTDWRSHSQPKIKNRLLPRRSDFSHHWFRLILLFYHLFFSCLRISSGIFFKIFFKICWGKCLYFFSDTWTIYCGNFNLNLQVWKAWILLGFFVFSCICMCSMCVYMCVGAHVCLGGWEGSNSVSLTYMVSAWTADPSTASNSLVCDRFTLLSIL